MNMDINETVKKAKKFKKQDGVGPTTTKLSRESNDFLARVLRRSIELLKKLDELIDELTRGQFIFL